MEQLDEPFALDIHRRLAVPQMARVFSAREHDASRMTVLLRSLDLLVTSRYHACVLSLAAHVPQVAVGHDLRLETIYRELGLAPEFFVRQGDAAPRPGSRRASSGSSTIPRSRRSPCIAGTCSTWWKPGATASC
jgi:polysaccharide pyruvyl transferase WcaK-like protein